MIKRKSNPFDDSSFVEAYNNYKELINERMKTVKKGPNVIHLEYVGGDYCNDLLIDYEKRLNKVDLEFSSFDKSGIPYNKFDDQSLLTFLVIGQPIITQILKSTISGAIWDVIKYITKSYWSEIKRLPFAKISGGEAKKSKISFGLKYELDRHRSFSFKLEGDVSADTIDKVLDKSLPIVKDLVETKKELSKNYIYDYENQKWMSSTFINDQKSQNKKE